MSRSKSKRSVVDDVRFRMNVPQVVTRYHVAESFSTWRAALPTLSTPEATLRELQPDDAPSLLAHLGTEQVSRFITPLPTTVEGYERLASDSARLREAGLHAGFAIVPAGSDLAVGLVHLRSLEPGFATAEVGFAIGSAYWGTGLFVECATRVLEFAFDTIGVVRLEARAAVMNGRGNGALRKIGAVQEGVLRRSFKRNGQFLDQVLWSILAEDWRLQRTPRRSLVH